MIWQIRQAVATYPLLHQYFWMKYWDNSCSNLCTHLCTIFHMLHNYLTNDMVPISAREALLTEQCFPSSALYSLRSPSPGKHFLKVNRSFWALGLQPEGKFAENCALCHAYWEVTLKNLSLIPLKGSNVCLALFPGQKNVLHSCQQIGIFLTMNLSPDS